MTSDLSAYAALAAKLPLMTAEDNLLIGKDDFPFPLDALTPFDGMVLDTARIRHLHWAGEGDLPFEVIDRVRGFDGFAMPEGYRRFGLWLLHLLFSGREWAGLELTHPKSRAATFYAHIQHPAEYLAGLRIGQRATYSGYDYWPQEVTRHAFAGSAMTPVQRLDHENDRPFFTFGWSQKNIQHQWNYAKADQIIFDATPPGIAALAALMIDMAHPSLGRDEVNIEAPVIGYAATQPRSIEARFWLPGSFAFPEDKLDDLWLAPFPAAAPAGAVAS